MDFCYTMLLQYSSYLSDYSICFLIFLYSSIKYWSFPECWTLAFLFSFYTVSLSELVLSYGFQHNILVYINSQIIAISQTSLSSYPYIQSPNLHLHLNASQTSQT